MKEKTKFCFSTRKAVCSSLHPIANDSALMPKRSNNKSDRTDLSFSNIIFSKKKMDKQMNESAAIGPAQGNSESA